MWKATTDQLIVGFDDSGNTQTNIPGFFKPDGDFNDAMISFEFLSFRRLELAEGYAERQRG